jgi:hypothetical protein
VRIPSPRRGRAALAVALGAMLALTGCGGIPTGGPVTAGDLVGDDVELDIGFAPQGPRTGAPQEEILQDFVNAATNPQNDYAVAREFLAENLTAEWDPDATTYIRSGVGAPQRTSETSFDYSITSVAYVDRDGRYFEGDPLSATLPFGFVKEGDEWRISSAPPGIVLSADRFPLVFGEYALYYFDPTYQFLVPEIRWFPKRSSTSIRAVSALLAGQANWLSNGVLVSAFPAGTALGDGLVSIASGVATVDLTDEARESTEIERDRMRQQLSSSLATVSSVILTVGGIQLPTPDAGSNAAVVNPTVEAAPLIVRDNELGYVTNDDLAPVAQISGKVGALSPQAVTLGRGKLAAAVLAPGGVYSVRANAPEPLLVDDRAGLTAPSLDNSGYIWSAPEANASAIRVIELDGTQHEVTTSLPPDARVISLSVSRDGTRLLLYLSTGSGPELLVAGIIRQQGLPTAIGETFALGAGSATPIDAAWVDERTVATLSSTGDSTTITSFEIGGPSAGLGRLDGAVQIAGGRNGRDGLRVLTAEGEIFRTRGSSWQLTDATAQVLATQQ